MAHQGIKQLEALSQKASQIGPDKSGISGMGRNEYRELNNDLMVSESGPEIGMGLHQASQKSGNLHSTQQLHHHASGVLQP